MKASDLFVKALENEGVEYIFGVPGEENLDLVESIRTSSIKLIVTRHEQAAAFMAATYGRLTGKPGVCLATLGPGALNLVNGVAYAQLGGMPHDDPLQLNTLRGCKFLLIVLRLLHRACLWGESAHFAVCPRERGKECL